MRGKHWYKVDGGGGGRSIPACAGETDGLLAGDGRRRVYPRVCGGNAAPRRPSTSGGGLSPRVRGKRRARNWQPAPPGSIPACAGETHHRLHQKDRAGVYPRVCGGNRFRLGYRYGNGGLSPRVRGKHLRNIIQPSPPRSIPACAGETVAQRRASGRGWVYPRVCGGNRINWPPNFHGRGLSPRVRGKPSFLPRVRSWGGSIPACAGETFTCLEPTSYDEVYPRVCGGNAITPIVRGFADGLSLRVRGKRPVLRGADPNNGSIPACAGVL